MRQIPHYIQHLIKHLGWKSLILFSSILLGVGVLIINLFPVVTQSQIEAVEASIDALYQDEQQVFLKEDVTERMVQTTIRQVNRLRGEAKKQLYPKAILTKEKFGATHRLNNIYQLPQMGEKNFKELPFLAEVNQTIIASNTEMVDWIVEDEGTEILDYLTVNAGIHWEIMTYLESTVAELGQREPRSRDEIVNMAASIGLIGEQVAAVKHHPQTERIAGEFHPLVHDFVERLKGSHQIEPYTRAALMPLFNSAYARSLIENSELDIRPKVALTFDDGPNETYTTQVLAILEEYGIQATFFVVGKYVELYPEVDQRIVAEGHTIANHSYDHPDFSTISDQQVLEQIGRTQTIIEAATGITPDWYRMPYGSGGERVYRLLPNLTSVTWNTDTEDWLLRDTEAIYENTMTQLSDDMLVLLHDTNQNSVDVLEKLLVSLTERQYRFVSPLELDFDSRY